MDERFISPRFPRSSAYHPEWLLAGVSGGANPLWLAEWLAEAMDLRPGMRLLDLGCGRAMSSVFLRREFGVQVWATDLWISASEDLWCLHSADWWRRHWERAGVVEVERADTLPDGWQLWRDWIQAVAPDNAAEIGALEADRGNSLGYVRAVGRRRADVVLDEPVVS